MLLRLISSVFVLFVFILVVGILNNAFGYSVTSMPVLLWLLIPAIPAIWWKNASIGRRFIAWVVGTFATTLATIVLYVASYQLLLGVALYKSSYWWFVIPLIGKILVGLVAYASTRECLSQQGAPTKPSEAT